MMTRTNRLRDRRVLADRMFFRILFAIIEAILIVSLRRCRAPGMSTLPTRAIPATRRSVTGSTVSMCASVYRFH